MADAPRVTVTVEDRFALITINNPPVNVLSRQTMGELQSALARVKQEAAVKVVIITGAGAHFIAGADVKEIAQLKSPQEAQLVAAEGQAVITGIQRLGKPVIAAINGFCLGGGCELALACHLRIAGEQARLGQPEINLGIIPGFGGTQRLARLVGKAKATELILTGDLINAPEALRIGLVNKVVPSSELLKQAKDLARKIASKGQPAIACCLQAIEEGLTKSLDEGLALEAQLFGRIAQTKDMREGLTAFLEKRQPQFTDR